MLAQLQYFENVLYTRVSVTLQEFGTRGARFFWGHVGPYIWQHIPLYNFVTNFS